jgi:hypothetical protein
VFVHDRLVVVSWRTVERDTTQPSSKNASATADGNSAVTLIDRVKVEFVVVDALDGLRNRA